MELHRFAIILVAALLALSIAFAAGHVASDGDESDPAKNATPAPAASVSSPRSGADVPQVRLGGGAETGGVQAPPLVEQPTPAPQP